MSIKVLNGSANGAVLSRLQCNYCKEWIYGTANTHVEHVSKCMVEWEQKVKAQQEFVQSRAAHVMALPTKQTVIKTIDLCKRLLGRDAVVVRLIQPHDIRTEAGIIQPADTFSVAPNLAQLMNKSTYARVIRVSEHLSRTDDGKEFKYPYLNDWRETVDSGGIGPVVEIAPGSGAERCGENGESILFLHAVDIWAEYAEGED